MIDNLACAIFGSKGKGKSVLARQMVAEQVMEADRANPDKSFVIVDQKRDHHDPMTQHDFSLAPLGFDIVEFNLTEDEFPASRFDDMLSRTNHRLILRIQGQKEKRVKALNDIALKLLERQNWLLLVDDADGFADSSGKFAKYDSFPTLLNMSRSLYGDVVFVVHHRQKFPNDAFAETTQLCAFYTQEPYDLKELRHRVPEHVVTSLNPDRFQFVYSDEPHWQAYDGVQLYEAFKRRHPDLIRQSRERYRELSDAPTPENRHTHSS